MMTYPWKLMKFEEKINLANLKEIGSLETPKNMEVHEHLWTRASWQVRRSIIFNREEEEFLYDDDVQIVEFSEGKCQDD